MKNKKQLSIILTVLIAVTCVCLNAWAIDPNTVLYLTGEGATITDSSGKNYQITVNGNTTISTAYKKFGNSSIYFDGDGDYLRIADSNDWDFGSGDFTIDFWYYPTNLSGEQFFVANYDNNASGTAFGIRWYSPNLQVNAGPSWVDAMLFNTPLTVGSWQHIAYVGKDGNKIMIFKDGVQVGATINHTYNISSSTYLEIGRQTNSSSYLKGYLDEFRITKGKALWTTGPFEPPAPPPEVSLTTDKTSINFGESAVLTWSTSGATGCVLTPGTETVDLSGTTTVAPTATTTYALKAGGVGGTTIKEVTVKVLNGYTVAGKFTVDGKMGIGVLNPQKELEVNGTIKTKEVQVDITGWADYVFDNAYNLRSIESLEAYIREHKHLPEMSSAEELKQQGLSVTEILQKQMQKIEELTLYLIQLQKENENLEKRVKQLEVQ